jgi:hypothetical protein
MFRLAVDLIKGHFSGRKIEDTLTEDGSARRWLDLLSFARRHWVSPIIHKVIERDRLDVPPEILDAFQNDYYASARRNALLLNAVEQVVERMATAGVEVIVLRGASLAETVYGDAALRPMADADLLIRPDVIHDVARLMGELGYRLHDAVDYCAQFQHEPSKSLIEIHWAIGGGSQCFNVAFESLWKERQPLRVGSVITNQLSPEDAILLTSFHIGFQHSFAVRLISLLDMYVLTATPPKAPAWDSLVRRACGFKLSHLVYAVGDVASRVFGDSIPAEVMRELRSHCTRLQLHRLRTLDLVERFAGEKVRFGETDPDSSPLARFFWTYRGKDKLRLLRATLRADKSPLNRHPARSNVRLPLLRRLPWLIKTYAWPLAKQGLQWPRARRKPG